MLWMPQFISYGIAFTRWYFPTDVMNATGRSQRMNLSPKDRWDWGKRPNVMYLSLLPDPDPLL